MTRVWLVGIEAGKWEPIPRGYRVAYVDVARHVKVLWPWGIHLLVRAWRRLAERRLRYRPSDLEALLAQHGDRRYREGYAAGVAFGRRQQAVLDATSIVGVGRKR